MSGWIKFEKSLQDDPRVLRMAKALAAEWFFFNFHDSSGNGEFDPCNATALPAVTLVCGALTRIWIYADTHAREDDTLDLGVKEIDELVGIPGFCALMPADWLVEIDDKTVELPGFQAHNGTEAKKRALTQKRVERHRETKKHESVTPCNAGALPDQDQTKTSKKQSAARAKSKTALPSDFSLTDDLREYAAKHLPNVDPPALFESFRGKALAKAWTYANWHQAFQEYIRNCAPNSGHWAAGQYPKTNGGIQWQ